LKRLNDAVDNYNDGKDNFEIVKADKHYLLRFKDKLLWGNL
jgi:hypothetical protein